MLMARLEKKLERAEKEKAPAQMGRLEITALPWGDVFVDGRMRGRSPPKVVLDIPAGSHTIEIRNDSTFPSRVEKVNVKAGEAAKITHRFKR